MNNSNQETINLAADASQYSVAPGDKLEISVVMTNQGSTPERLRITVEGIPMVWVFTEHQIVLLQPGEQRQISLTIHPPALPEAQIGRYLVRLLATSVIVPTQAAQTQFTLSVAGFEVRGRVGVLLEGVQYSVTPGDPLALPVVLVNQGLGADTFRLSIEGLPEGWVNLPEPDFQLAPGEAGKAALTIQPPRDPSSRASRYPCKIQVSSQEAPNQGVTIDCTLTVAAFTEFKSSLEAAQPDQNLPAKVLVHNLSNIPASFRVDWSSPEDSLRFTPDEPQQINVPSGEAVSLEYTVQPARRPLFGGEKSYPYNVNVQAADQQTQTLEGSLMAKGLLPTWVLFSGLLVLLLLCLYVLWSLRPGSGETAPPGTATLTATSQATAPLPTATQSQVDQRPLLIERNWFLVAFNNTSSSAGAQEASILFNPDGTLIGHTGCKDFRGSYQTDFNQISVSDINLGPGSCPDTALQQQEDASLAILRSARSYFVADTALQIAGDAGFLNYSLTPVNRSDEIVPPRAAILAVSQAFVGQVVVFDGSASTGQVQLVSWRWDFGDGGSASGVVVQHAYQNPGTYNARLTVTDQRGQTGTTTQQITIQALPTATLQPTGTPVPPTATIEPTPLPPTAPPEQPTEQPTPTVLPEAPTDTPVPPTDTPEPTPEPEPPQANIAGPSQGFIGEPVTFDASASQPGSSPIVSFSWSLGNGSDLPAAPESSISTTYNRAGVYEVLVFVQDANGLSSQATTRINIDARLDTAVWTLAAINEAPLLPGTAITLQFLQGELAGFAGCNTYHGGYTATANEDGTYTIAVGQLQTSRLACPQNIMDQENQYVNALQQATVATIQENRITLNTPFGALIFYLVEPN
jgi:heat shock protein HslJ